MKYFFILLVVFFFCFSCIDINDPCSQFNPDQCTLEYNFEFEYSCDIETGIISVEDTFSISMEVSDIVEDIESGILYDVRDYNYSISFYMYKLDPNLKIYEPPSRESYEALAGSSGSRNMYNSPGDLSRVSIFLEENGNQKTFQFNVVPKEKGLYIAGIDYDDSFFEERDGNRIDITDTCCPESIVMKHSCITAYDNSLDAKLDDLKGWVYQESGNLTDFDDERWTNSGIFIFEVL